MPEHLPSIEAQSKARWREPRVRAAVAIGAILLLAGWGIFSRLEARADLRRATEEESAPTVVTARVAEAPLAEKLVLPGTVESFMTAPIYARTNGYLKRWLVDIGAPVKAGQLLAEIDTPEVDQQLKQTEADLRTAEANENLARTTAERWEALLKTDSVSKQEAEERASDYTTKQALTASARANLQRLHDLQGFQHIVAPFDGTITARNIDVGQLVSNGGGRELFHIADLRRLRVYVQVPQPYAPAVQVGLEAALAFAERPTQSYPARIVRTAGALDAASRTLLVELEVDNTKGELFPGAYTEVHFAIPAAGGTVRIPANALIFGAEGLFVAVPGSDSHVILKPVTLGRDFGTEIEVTSGLAANETVIVNPPDSLMQGSLVRIAQAPADEGTRVVGAPADAHAVRP